MLRELKTLDVVALSDPKTIAALDASVRQVVREFEPGAARDFLRGLEEAIARFPEFERTTPAAFQAYQEMILRLKFSAFTFLTDNDIDELFSAHILFALRNDIDVRTLLYLRLSFYEDGLEHGAMRRRYIQRFHENMERLGSAPLTMKESSDSEEPFVSNWLRDYDQFFESFRIRSGFEQASYLSQSANVKKLNENEKEILAKLLRLYDFMRFPIMQTEIVGTREPVAAPEERAPLLPSPVSVQTAAPTAIAPTVMVVQKPVAVLPAVLMVKPEMPKPAVVAVSHDAHPLRVELEEVVDKVMEHGAHSMEQWDELLKKRFRAIVSARLRGVRDAVETSDMLARAVKIGGMGMTNAMEHGAWSIEQSMEQIEKAFSEFQEKWKAFEKKRIEDWKKKQQEQRVQQVQREQVKGQEDLDVRYRRLVGDNGAARQSAVPPSALGGQTSPNAAQARRPALPLEEKKEKIQSAAVKPPPPKPSLPPPKLTSVVLPPGKVTDVRTPQKLVGPVEELKGLTLEDFRRLGTPDEAVAKISARIDMFGKESLNKRVDGIKAWQMCEVNRTYQAITAASFSQRKNMLEILEERKTANLSTLTPDEFRVIMELNQKLRF